MPQRASDEFTATRTSRYSRHSSERPSISTSGGADRRGAAKEPVLQLFVMPVGLPRRRALRVVCMTEGSEEPLGCTQPQDRTDPLFSEPLELWSEASGKEGSIPLTFLMKAQPVDDDSSAPAHVSDGDGNDEAREETLAIARIASDELRRFGLYNPREGAAVALPLTTAAGEPLPAACALHCYVHVGYSVRRTAGAGTPASTPRMRGVVGHDAATRVSISRAPSTATSSAQRGVSGAEEAAGFASGAKQRAALQVEYAVRPLPDPLSVLLRVRGRNVSRSRALRIASIDLRPPPPWELRSTIGIDLARVLVPPAGAIEAAFVMHHSGGALSFPPTNAIAASASSETAGSIAGLSASAASAASAAPATPATPALPPTPTPAGYHPGLHGVESAAPTPGTSAMLSSGAETRPAAELKIAYAACEATRAGTLTAASGERAPARLMRSVRVPLLPPAELQPVTVLSHRLSPSTLRVGETVGLQVTLAWPAIVTHAVHNGGAADATAEGTAGVDAFWLVEIDLVPSKDWLLLGMHRQRLRLPLPHNASKATDAACTLDWKLVPLTAGHVPLPAIRMTRHPLPGHDSLSESLPPPPWLCGSMVLVERCGATQGTGTKMEGPTEAAARTPRP
jgi:hypothetical protein